jgi:hypothetical protein
MTDYDPVSTQVGPHRFEAGKAVEVSDEVYDRLSKNPWFSGDKKAAEKLVTAGNTAPGPDSGIDSSVMPAYPPGGGMKYAPDARDDRRGHGRAGGRFRRGRRQRASRTRPRSPVAVGRATANGCGRLHQE